MQLKTRLSRNSSFQGTKCILDHFTMYNVIGICRGKSHFYLLELALSKKFFFHILFNTVIDRVGNPELGGREKSGHKMCKI